MIQKEITNFVRREPENTDIGYPFDRCLRLQELEQSVFIIYRFFTKIDEKYDNEYAVMEASFVEGDEHFCIRTTSQVLINQLRENTDILPMRVGVEKRTTIDGDRFYWTFTEPKNETV